jgi:hypothetical protein
MTYEEMSAKVNNKAYESKLPYPPYRHEAAERAAHKDEDTAAKNAYRTDENRLEALFRADLREYLEVTIGKKLTEKQWGAIFSKAWEDGHSAGYHEVLQEADEIADLAKILLEAKP